MKKMMAVAAALVFVLVIVTPSKANAAVAFRIGVGPVVVGTAPVYVAPAPVYVAPAPLPPPVVVYRPYAYPRVVVGYGYRPRWGYRGFVPPPYGWRR